MLPPLAPLKEDLYWGPSLAFVALERMLCTRPERANCFFAHSALQHPLLQEGRLAKLQTVHILIQGIWLPGILFYKKPAKDRLVIRTSCLRHSDPALQEAGGLVDAG